MPKAKKTKAGTYRCRIVDHYERIDGKRKIVYKSFTAPSKTECELLAAAYQESKEESAKTNITVDEALDRYIKAKENVLAPYTVRSYKSYKKNAYDGIRHLKVQSLRSEDVQIWMNTYKLDHSPKSCRNASGLLTAAIKLQRPSVRFNVTLPQKCPPELYTPTDADIKTLLDHIKGTELEKAVLLSAFGTLRRGEVCAITYDDIHGDEIRVNKELVRVNGKGWIVKAPKTPQSIRTVKYPHAVIERLLQDQGKAQRVVQLVPDTITKKHKLKLRECGLPEFRFHDLRAYAVSIRHALGIPDVYIMQDGGYKTDTVMKQIYRRAMSDKRKEFADIASAHFEELMGQKKVNKKVNNVSSAG
ncbi:MAG: site-specific integrase [Ruminococcus sp.]|nr:site-specific integrase [Ruminococcus sp.]